MTKPFDPTKTCQTRDGRKVRILCADAPGRAPVIAIFESSKECWQTGAFYADGKYTGAFVVSVLDLVNIPERKKLKGWLNVYSDCSCGSVNETKAYANSVATPDRIACLDLSKYNIEFQEGEGL